MDGPITLLEDPGQGNPSEPDLIANCGCEGDPINTAFGTLSEVFYDMTIPGRGLSLSFTHTYNSAFAASDGPLGFGWTHSYAMQLIKSSATGAVTITQENGSQVTFNLVGSTYVAAPRVIATLVQNADGTFSFSRRAQQFFTFSPSGQLLSESDRHGYISSLKYNGTQLVSVTDPAGRKLIFSYNGSQISRITDPIGRHVNFAYDTAGNLATVTDVNGAKPVLPIRQPICCSR
jgi:YD repeat-containing protein